MPEPNLPSVTGSAGTTVISVLIPWTKVAKMAGKLFKAAKKIYKAVTGFQQKLSWARNTMKRYNDAVDAAMDRAKRKFNSIAEAPSCNIGNSFIGDTEVVMSDGLTKPIDEVEAGGEVLATDEASGQTEAREVVTTIEGTGDRTLVEISLDTDGDGRVDATVTATDGHPIWVADLAQVLIEDAFGGNLADVPGADTVPAVTDADGSGSGGGGPPPGNLSGTTAYSDEDAAQAVNAVGDPGDIDGEAVQSSESLPGQ